MKIKEFKTKEMMRKGTLAMLTLLPVVSVNAQDEDDEEDFMPRGSTLDDEEINPFNDFIPFRFSRYSNEITILAILAIVITIINHFVKKQHRRGCSFFAVAIVILYFVIKRVF